MSGTSTFLVLELECDAGKLRRRSPKRRYAETKKELTWGGMFARGGVMKRRKIQRPDIYDDRTALALMGLDSADRDINTGSTIIRSEDLLQKERPSTAQDAFRRARGWTVQNWFVTEVLKLKLAFYNYGFKLTAVDPGKRKKIRDWLQANPDQARLVERYEREAWREWLTLRNVVSFWREETQSPPVLLPPEDCKFKDAMGTPRLWVRFEYKPDDAPKGLTLELKKRYFSGKVFELDEAFDEHFDVLTAQRRGQGFGMPDMYSIFATMGQTESMEIGEQMLALASRRVIHLHKIGFEQKGQNPSRYQQKYSLWTKERSKNILAFTNGRFGFMETTMNFDQQMSVFLGDGGPKSWDGRKWDSAVRRLLWWGGPLGFMMVANSMNPFLLNMLKTTAAEERSEVTPHLNLVLNSAIRWPTPVKVTYSNRCFIDSRLAWDMVSGLLKQGPLSATTSLEETDFDPAAEAENKRQEAQEPELYTPAFNPGGQDGEGKRGPKVKKEGSTTKRSGATSGSAD